MKSSRPSRAKVYESLVSYLFVLLYLVVIADCPLLIIRTNPRAHPSSRKCIASIKVKVCGRVIEGGRRRRRYGLHGASIKRSSAFDMQHGALSTTTGRRHGVILVQFLREHATIHAAIGQGGRTQACARSPTDGSSTVPASQLAAFTNVSEQRAHLALTSAAVTAPSSPCGQPPGTEVLGVPLSQGCAPNNAWSWGTASGEPRAKELSYQLS